MKRPDADKRLNAHLRHEMGRFSEAGLRKTIREEILALWEWLGGIGIGDLVVPAQARALLQRLLVDAEITDDTVYQLSGIVGRAHATLAARDIPVSKVLSRHHYKALADAMINLEELRHELVYQAVTSPVYSQLISEVLYSGIKEFITSENVFVRSIPGASSLISMSRELVSMTAAGVEKQIDKRLIDFIQSHIQDTIRQSERLLNQAMEEGFLEDLAGEIWSAVESESFSTIADYIDAASVESVTPVVIDGWRQFRRTGCFSEILDDIVSHFYDRYGDRSVRAFLEDLGITRDAVMQWAEETLCPLLAKGQVREFLEQRIRSRLASFYFKESNG